MVSLGSGHGVVGSEVLDLEDWTKSTSKVGRKKCLSPNESQKDRNESTGEESYQIRAHKGALDHVSAPTDAHNRLVDQCMSRPVPDKAGWVIDLSTFTHRWSPS